MGAWVHGFGVFWVWFKEGWMDGWMKGYDDR
jgi:hypothetical protein